MGYWINRACSQNDNTSFCFNKHYTTKAEALNDWTGHGYSEASAVIVFVDDITPGNSQSIVIIAIVLIIAYLMIRGKIK